MAGKFRVAFAIEGDATKAIKAVENLANSINRLAAILEFLSGVAESAGAAQTKSADKANKAYKEATKQAEKYAEALMRVQQAGGAGGAIVPPKKPPMPPAGQPPLQLPDGSIDAQWRDVTALANFEAFMKKVAAGAGQLTISMAKFGATAVSAFLKARTAAMGFLTSLQSQDNAISKSIRSFGGFVDKVRQGIMNINDAFRYTTQAITNVGRSLFFFVSIPLAGFFSGLTKAAIDFEDAMVRVAKTTDLPQFSKTGESIERLTANLRELAKNTSSSHVELAKLAEIIGQMGVTSVNAITNLTNIFEMFTVATDLSAENVAEGLGRIANAFGWNLNESSEKVFKLANVINLLENTTASSAGEIMNATAGWAQAAAQLQITADKATALSASLVSMGLSGDEAGTALKNLSFYLIKNADDVAKLMSNNEGYGSTQEVLNAINEDAVKVMMDLAKAASMSDDRAKALLATMEIGAQRGGRALAALASNFQMVDDNLKAAETEWENAVSLAIEYERALQSTASQMKMLRNNVNDVGITIGAAVLPVVNRLIQIVVPGIQMASKWFESLNKQTQLLYVAIAAAVVVVGPLLMFLGQIMHAVTLIVLGFGQLIRVFPMIANAVAALIPVIAGVGKFFLSWPGMVVAAIVGILKVLSVMGVNVAGFFTRLAKAAKSWGENLAKTYAGGFLAGAIRWIMAAVSAVARMIASFFQGHSPPKAGPLASIDKWGSKVMQAYLRGFKNADFSILSDVGRIIETILTRGADEKELPAAIKRYAKARIALAKVISKYNDTGLIDNDLLKQATVGLGHMADEVRELVKLSLEYNRIQERLAAIEARRKSTIKGYEDEIGAIGRSNMSIVDKVAAIRAAQRARDDGLRGLDKEEESLQAQAEVAKQQLDYQRQMIDAMNEQDDILQRMVDAIEALAEKLKDMAGAGGGILEDFAFPDTSGFGEGIRTELEKGMEPLMDFVDRFSDGRTMFQGLLDGLKGLPQKNFLTRGRDKRMEGDTDLQAGYDAMYKLGQRAAEVRDKVMSWAAAADGFIKKIQGINLAGMFDGDGLKAKFSEMFSMENLLKTPIIGDFINGLKAGFSDSSIGAIKSALDGLGKAWNDFITFLQTDEFKNWMTVIGAVLGAVARGIGWFAGFLIGSVGTVMAYLAAFVIWLFTLRVKLSTWVGTIQSAIATGFLAIPTILVNVWNAIKTGVITAWNAIKSAIIVAVGAVVLWLASAWEAIKLGVVTAWTAIRDTLLMKVNEALAFFGITEATKERWRLLWEDYKLVVSTVWDRIVEWITLKAMEIYNVVATWVAGVVAKALEIWNSLVSGLAAIGMLIVGAVVVFATGVYNAVSGWFTRVKDVAISIWNSLVSALKPIWDRLVADISSIMSKAYDDVVKAFSKISDWLSGQVSKIKEIGKSIIDGLREGISSGATKVVDAITKVAEDLMKAIKSKLGISSPSKIFEGFGKDLIQGFINGIENLKNSVVKAAEGIAKAVVDVFSSLFGKNKKTESMKIEDIVPKEGDVRSALARIETAVRTSTTNIQNLWRTMGTTLTTTWNQMITQLRTIWDNFWRTIQGTVTTYTQGISKAIKDMLTAIASNFKTAQSAVANLRDVILSAIDKAQKLFAELNKMDGKVINITIKITEKVSKSGSSSSNYESGAPTNKKRKPRRISGGQVLAGMLYKINEIGAEGFIPGKNGLIVPHYRMRQIGNAVDKPNQPVVQIIFNNPVVRDEYDLRKIISEVKVALAKENEKARRFGGSPAY